MLDSSHQSVPEIEVLPPHHYRVPALRNPFPSHREVNGGLFDSADNYFGSDSKCEWYEFGWRRDEEATSRDRICLLKRFDRAMSYRDIMDWSPSVYGPAILRNAFAFAAAHPNLQRERKIVIPGSCIIWGATRGFPLLCGDNTNRRLEAVPKDTRGWSTDYYFLFVVRGDAYA